MTGGALWTIEEVVLMTEGAQWMTGGVQMIGEVAQMKGVVGLMTAEVHLMTAGTMTGVYLMIEEDRPMIEDQKSDWIVMVERLKTEDGRVEMKEEMITGTQKLT